MTVAQLKTLLCQRLDEDAADPTYWTAAELLDALNAAQQVFVLLTLCLEKTGTIALTAATARYRVRGALSDFLLPLKAAVGSTRLRPSAISDLDAFNASWEATAGAPTRYAQVGVGFLAITPQPAAPGSTLSLTYAYEPAIMTADSTPEIPANSHEALVDYACFHLRIKEGGDALLSARKRLDAFLEEAGKVAELVRARSLAARYDTLPFELQRFDRSRLIGKGE